MSRVKAKQRGEEVLLSICQDETREFSHFNETIGQSVKILQLVSVIYLLQKNLVLLQRGTWISFYLLMVCVNSPNFYNNFSLYLSNILKRHKKISKKNWSRKEMMTSAIKGKLLTRSLARKKNQKIDKEKVIAYKSSLSTLSSSYQKQKWSKKLHS